MTQPIDATGPTDWNRRPELRKLRNRITPKLKKGKPAKVSDDNLIREYAKAINASADDVCARINAQREVPTGYTVRFPNVDATGPTNWDNGGSTLRKRIQAAIHRRMYGGGPVDPNALSHFKKQHNQNERETK